MAIEGNGGLGSSEAEEGQLMDPAPKRAPMYARQKQMRVRKAKTDAFEVKHYKKISKEKHVTAALDDDVRTLWGIAVEYEKMLKENGISTVQDVLWKLGLDHKVLWMILKKPLKWKTIVAHAKKSVPSGKRHVYYAEKDFGAVLKNMAELDGLIKGGKYYSVETLSNSQKVCADNLKREACAKWKDIEEYDGQQPLETNPRKRARFSQTDVVTCAPESCPSDIDLASSSYVGPLGKPGLDIGAPKPCETTLVPSGEAYENSMPDFEDCIFGSMLDDYIMDSPSLFQQGLSEKADGNMSHDAFWREADRSDSHLPGSSLDPPEQAGGNAVLSVGDGGSFERGGGSNSPRIEEAIFNQEAGNYQYQRNM